MGDLKIVNKCNNVPFMSRQKFLTLLKKFFLVKTRYVDFPPKIFEKKTLYKSYTCYGVVTT